MPRKYLDASMTSGQQQDWLTRQRSRFDVAAAPSDKVRAIFGAIRFCGAQEIALPSWAIEPFVDATDKWMSFDVGSLDEAFGLKPLSENALKKKKREPDLSMHVKFFVDYLLKKENVKKIPWEDQGDGNFSLERHFNLSKTVLQEAYYGPRKRKPSRENLKKSGKKSKK